MQINKTYTGHNIDILKTFPDKCIDCIITSPPYFQLRDYGTEHQIWGGDPNCEHEFVDNKKIVKSGGTNGVIESTNKNIRYEAISQYCYKCNAWKGELGLEPTFQMYIDHLIMVFAECKRVLKDEGTMWVNLGDSYASQSGGMRDGNFGEKATAGQKNEILVQSRQSLQSKCLLNIPSRFAIAMTDELGLILRNNIIWYKNNCMPSSATDRFTVDFENIMFFTKKKKYYFEQQFEKTQAKVIENRMKEEKTETYNSKYKNANVTRTMTRNMRTVWEINTQASKDKHYAMYPEKLLVRMIEAGCPKHICKKCGRARTKVVSADYKGVNNQHKNTKEHHNGQTYIISRGSSNPKAELISCNCNAGFHPGIVLDPFGGSGTTGITAKKLQRNFINIELNPEYSEISDNKYDNTIGGLFE